MFSNLIHRIIRSEALFGLQRRFLGKRIMATIGTHDGIFHCDESLACFMLKLLPQYKDAKIVRSREKSQLDSCDIVVDVGGVYDHAAKRYDHHQQTFHSTLSSIFANKTFGNVKLSSAGLVYAHFGHQIISNILGLPIEDPKTEKVFDRVYEHFVKEIDAIDNGINMFDGEPRYNINTHLSARVGNLKPHWNEPSNQKILYDRFLDAVALTGKEFLDCVSYYGNVWMPARSIIVDAFEKRFEIDPSGRILVLKQTAPWIQFLFELEEECNVQGQVLYVIFQDRDSWRVRAVPISPQSFELRKPIVPEWQGLKDEELSSKADIEDCVFVHSTGFIGGNKNLNGALTMARRSLAWEPCHGGDKKKVQKLTHNI